MEKLRKALEKAKQDAREERTGESLPKKESFSPAPSESLPGKISPVYTQSQVYEIDPKKLTDHRCICITPDAYETEYYKILRTQILQRTSPKNWNTIMITSALPGEGKTLTAINLALTFSREYSHTVLLVDCDLRQQQIHKVMGLPGERGLIDALVDGHPLHELIMWPGIEKLTVISGGRTISDTSEALSSPRMKALVEEIKFRYSDRYIFFDVPPVLSAADAISFAPLVDAVLMVVRAGVTSLDDVKKAVDLLPKEKFLGFVLNRHRNPSNLYAGTYYQKKAS